MTDFFEAGLIYVPAYLIGRILASYGVLDPFNAGWIVASIAVLLRWMTEPSRRASTGKASE